MQKRGLHNQQSKQIIMEQIEINGVLYIKKVNLGEDAYVIVRTYSAGVFAGNLVRRDGQEVELSNARRLWRWKGAATLSQLSQTGTSAPKECKFPEPMASVTLTQAIEIIPCTEAAKKSITGVL